MPHFTEPTRLIRHMSGCETLATCFVVRALKVYAKRVRSAAEADLSVSIPSEHAGAWKRVAKTVFGRLEAASIRGDRLDDAFFATLSTHATDAECIERFVARALHNYAKHVAAMPVSRISHSLRGIDATQWHAVAQRAAETLAYLAAFDEVPA